ncbi:MAG TPA: hypothetical protein VJN21_00540 [Candidatus Acidoferrales bacterium]|nr:hypothetical protein [Candidatus Acidoferrales bacterium]
MAQLPLRRALLLFAVGLALSAPSARAQVWRALGPSGGDVRSLAMDPRNPRDIYLGTTDGHVLGSRDAGEHWQLLGRAGDSREAVVTSLIVSPSSSSTLYASTWTRDARNEGGGVFVSDNGGSNWHVLGLAGHAIRALALAPSDSNELVAGALDGVFMSTDAGRTWQRISPAGDPELRNVDSVAFDPRDPMIIFAGTFHLPWKTLDGGGHWLPIHSGMVDDSDVFSLAVDPTLPSRIFATACSGIYRSENSGATWTRLQTLPDSARRTHTLMQDPLYPRTVYAGTTEGLWKTTDLGAHWEMKTPPNWVINAVLVLPDSGRVILGADQIGILVSDDGARFFHVSNVGFNHRQVLSMAFDPRRPGHALSLLANAPETVLVTSDGGATWFPTGPGLNAEKVRQVYASPIGWLAALNAGGLQRYDESRHEWLRQEFATQDGSSSARKVSLKDQPVFNDMQFTASGWYAATSSGLFISRDSGAVWQPLAMAKQHRAAESVLKRTHFLWAVSSGKLFRSIDGGHTWRWRKLPFHSGAARRISIAGSCLLAETDGGLFVSRDSGIRWSLSAHGLPAAAPASIVVMGQDWFASMPLGGLYLSRDGGQSWDRLNGTVAEGVFPVLSAGTSAGEVIAASATEGVYSIRLTEPSAPITTAAMNRR